jgi:Ca2+-dependent lipid-binding protein
MTRILHGRNLHLVRDLHVWILGRKLISRAPVLVASEAIERGEHLRLRVCDSDRYTADDAIGIVELDLAELADEASRSSQLIRRSDELEADHPGMRVQGTLHWSVRFCPLWQMSDEEMKKRVEEMRSVRRGEPSEVEIEKGMPGWLRWVQGVVERPPEWEEERKKRRKETLAWFTGEMERDEMEVALRPSEDKRSGVLQVSSGTGKMKLASEESSFTDMRQFHIHQCHGGYLDLDHNLTTSAFGL